MINDTQKERPMSRMDRIAVLTAELRDLCEQNADRRMAEHFGVKVEDLDEYDPRIGTSIRDLANANMEKWGEW